MLTEQALKKLKKIKSWVKQQEPERIFNMRRTGFCVLGQYAEAKDFSNSFVFHFPNDLDREIVQDLFGYDFNKWDYADAPASYSEKLTREEWLSIYKEFKNKFIKAK